MPRMQMTTATTMKAAFFAMLDRVGQVLADDSRVWAEMHCAAQDAFSSQLDSVIGASPLVNTRPDQFPSWATPAASKPQAKRVSAQRKGPPAPTPPRPSSTDHAAADVAGSVTMTGSAPRVEDDDAQG